MTHQATMNAAGEIVVKLTDAAVQLLEREGRIEGEIVVQLDDKQVAQLRERTP